MTAVPLGEVVRLRAFGLTIPQIAARLDLKSGTISSALSTAGLALTPEQIRARSMEGRAARFWAKVDQSAGPHGCWPWTGYRDPKGYGKASFDMGDRRHATLTHRASWFLHNGPIPDGEVIRHRCDNPPCCNPAHLEPGTFKDNMQDALDRKRIAYGERASTAKLTIGQVAEVKRLAAEGRLSQRAIGRLFGIHQVRVSQIHCGKTWVRAIEDHRALARAVRG